MRNLRPRVSGSDRQLDVGHLGPPAVIAGLCPGVTVAAGRGGVEQSAHGEEGEAQNSGNLHLCNFC